MHSPSLRSTLTGLVTPAYIPFLFLAFSGAALTPVFPQYLGGLGAGVATIGLVVSMKGFGQLTSDLPGGFLLARWGIVPVTIVSYLFAIVINCALFFVRDIRLVAALIFISGFFTSIMITAIMTLVRTTVAATMRGRALSGLGGALRVGMLIGPIAGGVIAERFGVPVIFLIRAAGFAGGLVSFLIGNRSPILRDMNGSDIETTSTRTPRPSTQDETRGARILRAFEPLRVGLKGRWYALFTVGFVILVLSILRSAREIVLPLVGQRIGLTPARIGLAMSVGAAFDLLLFIPAGVISDRHGRKTSITLCLTGFSLGLLMLLPARGVPPYLIGAAIIGIGNGFGAGINMTTGADLAPSGAVAEFLGLWRLYGDLGAAVGPILVGALSAALALGPAVAITAGIGLLGAVVMIRIAPETRDLER